MMSELIFFCGLFYVLILIISLAMSGLYVLLVNKLFWGLHVPSCKSETKFSCCLFIVILEMMGILLAVSSSSSSNP
jgi:hypothetical protein